MEKRTKVAIIGSRGYPYVYSGYETFIKETFEQLADKFDIHVYCHSRLFKDKPRLVNGITLHYLPSIDRKSLNQLSHSFISTLNALLFNRFDLILFVNTANGPFGLLTRLMRVKTAIITDGLEWKRPKWRGFGSKYFYWASKLSTKVFDVLISDSSEMRKFYKKEFKTDSVLIEYGAHLKYSTNPELIEQFNVVPNEYYLVVARLVPDNNADLIVKSFTNLRSSKKLIIVGDVPYEDEYARNIKAAASENVIFTGYITDQKLLQELYSNCFVYIHGHEHGGTNPTLLKALGYGCCILASDTVFSREVLQSEKHGVYFEKNVDSMSQKLDFLESNPGTVSTYKAESRTRISEYYNWPRIASEYEKLFIEMTK